MHQGPNYVHVGVAVRDHYTFGFAGRAAGVIDGQQIAFAHIGRSKTRRERLEQALVIEPAFALAIQRNVLFNLSQLRTNTIDSVHVVAIRADDSSPAVVYKVREVVSGEAII